jgi:hypothetical protein
MLRFARGLAFLFCLTWWPAAAEPPISLLAPAEVARIQAKQAQFLADRIDALAPQRPGIAELYFLGFAGFANQDVFLKEATSAQAVFDAHFDTIGRSLTLVNNRQSVDRYPLATTANLAAALKGVAQRMDVEEDVLVLFLTSHGYRRGWFGVEFAEFGTRNLNAPQLRTLLDESGIKWRVVVISACFSGAFIEALKDERTLILTASARNRASFGCSHHNAFTYFGEAYVDHALRRNVSLIDAFVEAREEIAERERREELPSSDPQIEMGAGIVERLDTIEQRLLTLRPAGDRAQAALCAPRPNTLSIMSACALSNWVVLVRTSSISGKVRFAAGRWSILATQAISFGYLASVSLPRYMPVLRAQGQVAMSAMPYSAPPR